MDRLKQVILGFLFWIAFGPLAILTILIQPICILIFGSGNDNIRGWVYRTGKASDQLLNASIFGGEPQETISSHAGRWIVAVNTGVVGKYPVWVWCVDKITGVFEKNHCVNAIEKPFIGEPL